MNWINSSDIKNWADKESRKCSEHLPLMIRYLVNETGSDFITKKLFPARDAIHYEGPDGITKSTKATSYIPKGLAIWECSIEKGKKEKAEKGYLKNTDKPIGFEPKNSTFIFVTPRIWNYNHKEAWIKEKKNEGKWNDIRIYDARDLEEWFDQAPVTGAKFAKKILGKYPIGVQPAEDFLIDFLNNPKVHLKDSLILAGRDKENEKIINWLKGNESRFVLKSLTREEALAFLCACISNLEKEEKEKYFSKCLIVKNIDEFKDIANEYKEHILINYFDNFDAVDLAVEKKHHVFVPIGPDITIVESNAELKVLSRGGLQKELKEIGFSDDESEYYSKESGRSLSVLRRILLGKMNQPDWLKKKNIKDIFPLLLAGRWDETKKWDEKFKKQLDSEDEKIISKLANIPYEEYIERLSIYFKNSDDPPVYQIGNKWRLVSPIDAWLALNKFLTSSHLEKFKKIVYEVIGELDPEFELNEDERYMASSFGKVRKYSEWLREGILQTLILAAIFGYDKQEWVDGIVNNLFRSADSKKWFSLSNMLPQLAEASPDIFLDNVEYSLNSDDKSIFILFREGKNAMFSRCNHAGLLWALEGLAWFPEYLPRVTLILGKLSEFDPGGKWANRPIKTLRSIFLAWLPNTTATLQQRFDVLDLLIKEDENNKSDIENNVSFKLLLDLLPKTHDIGEPIFKPRWRGFSKLNTERVTKKEKFETYSNVLDRLLKMSGNNGILLSKIFQSYDDFDFKNQEKIYNHINNAIDIVTIGKKELWNSIREMISRHKTFRDAKWALPIEIVNRLEVLFRKIKIDDLEVQYKWLFDDYFPHILEGDRKNHEEFAKKVEEERVDAVNEIYLKNGLNGILDLSEKVKFPQLLGESLAKSNKVNEDEENFIINLFDKNENLINFDKGYTYYKIRKFGENWIERILNYLKNQNAKKEIIINFLTTLEHNEYTWKTVESFCEEIKSGFWQKCNGLFGDEYSEDFKSYYYENMIKYKRFLTAIDTTSMYPKNVKSEFIVELLEKAATTKSNEPFKLNIEPYHVNDLFKILDERDDFKDYKRLLSLEWYYIDILTDLIYRESSHKRSPKIIYKDLSEHPTSFIDIIKMLIKPKDDEEMMKKEIKGLSEKQIEIRAHKAFEILNSFDIIPGSDENGKINYEKLFKWVKEVIQLSKDVKREYHGKYYIGELFSNTIEKDSLPPDEICQVFEEIKDNDLEQGFKIGSYNKRGTWSKGVFEGGIEEKELAKHYLELSKKIEFKYPRTSKIYKDISNSYEFDAKREDDRATEEEMEY